MKRFISYCTILFAILFASCNNTMEGLDPTEALFVSVDNIEIEANGGEHIVKVNSYCPWTLESSEDWEWITTSKKVGSKGDSNIKLVFSENQTVEHRTAIITIKNLQYNLKHNIAVLQKKGDSFLLPSKDSIMVTAKGINETITVESNVNYIISSSQEWCKVNSVKGESGVNKIEVDIEPNTTTSERTAKITFKNSEHNITREIAVSQSNLIPDICISDSIIAMTETGGNKAITLTSNINWNATCEANWVKLSPVNGDAGTKTVTVTIEKNTDVTARETCILISNSEYGISKEITVNQSAFNANLEVSNSEISANSEGETKNVTVSSTIDWIASSDAEWITLSPVNGSKGNTTLGVRVANNEFTTPRVDSIIVSNSQYNIARTIIVNQGAFVPSISAIAGTSFTVEYMNGTKFIDIDTNVEYIATSDADWLTIEKTRDGINIKYTMNRDESNSRTATVILSSLYYDDVSIELSITQVASSSDNIIRYTCTGGILSPNVQTGFGANIIGLRAENGVGEIIFDSEITSIASDAFSNCNQLTSIIIPSTVTTIGNNAFKNCSALESIDLPSGTTSIGSEVFSSCTALTSVTLPEDLANISSNLFYGCSSLTTVDMPSSITYIGSNAFYNCTALENIEIPEGVSTIDSYAFCGCSSLESIEIPAGVTAVNERLFSECTSLRNVELPSTVTAIGSYAFYNCSALESIEIPEGVSSISSYAFNNCSALESIEIHEGVTAVNERLFSGCTSLRNVELPSTVTAIGSYAFYNCSALESIDLPLEVTSIGQNAFYNCSKINYVCIPSKVSSIGQYAFYNCSSLSVVVCTGKTPATGGSNMFGYNANGRNIFVPVGCSSTYRSYSYWSNYSSSIYDIEYTPTECTSLSITAEDVDADATSTIITYTAITNGTTPYGYVSNIEMTGRVQSASFPANTSDEDIEIPISYTYMGQTATTTITQAAPIRKSYTVNLNNAWRKSTSVSNPNSSLYDGVYESYSNWNVNSGTATMYIDIDGYDEFTIYVRSYGENNFDYVTVSYLDDSSIKTTTKGMSTSGTSIGSYTKVTYSNIGGGSHRITVKYKKDGSGHDYNDRGYLLIPKNQ